MVSGQGKVDFAFRGAHFDTPRVSDKWDVIVKYVGDFSIIVENELVYSEVDFCLVEFALDLAHWCAVSTDLGPNFIYSSVESEVEGLVSFTRASVGRWHISTAFRSNPSPLVSTAALRDASRVYLVRTRESLLPQFDMLDYIEDSTVLSFAHGFIA
jgi:hypothetical protein